MWWSLINGVLINAISFTYLQCLLPMVKHQQMMRKDLTWLLLLVWLVGSWPLSRQRVVMIVLLVRANWYFSFYYIIALFQIPVITYKISPFPMGRVMPPGPMDTDRSWSSIHLLKSFQRNSTILEGKHEYNMTWNSMNSSDAWDAELIQQSQLQCLFSALNFCRILTLQNHLTKKSNIVSVIPYCFMNQLFFTHSGVLQSNVYSMLLTPFFICFKT